MAVTAIMLTGTATRMFLFMLMSGFVEAYLAPMCL